MEDLSDLSIDFDGKISSIPLDDLYTSMDNDFTDCALEADSSRPSSAMSFTSWTFSPIADERTEIKDVRKSHDTDAEGKHNSTLLLYRNLD